MSGRATIARITAERLGCKDPTLLKLIERLASSNIEMKEPEFSRDPEPFYFLSGTMDGKQFRITLSGPAVVDFG
jgi:hypothetical protein